MALCWAVGFAAADPGEYLKKPDAWFAGNEGRRVAANILSFQSELGGWPKNVSTAASPYQGDRRNLVPTYDNGATTDELRFLARIYTATGQAIYRAAFSRGFGYVLAGQYAHGGWPQSYPPGKGYQRHITFNDNAMVRLLELVREVATEPGYGFVDEACRKRAAEAFDRGIGCILKCQIKVGDKLTAWCAQHDEIDFRPRPARSYELAALSGAESVDITRLLMSLDDPSAEVVRAVESAIVWFETARLTGLRMVSVKDDQGARGLNKIVVKDSNAPSDRKSVV